MKHESYYDINAHTGRVTTPYDDEEAAGHMAKDCGECDGTGVLDTLGGDWGKTAPGRVSCWKCGGSGKEKAR